MTEHWKNAEQIKTFNLLNYNLASYYCRQNSIHGGSAIYVQQGVLWKDRTDVSAYSEEKTFECSAVGLVLGKYHIVILSVYRSPNADIELFLNKVEIVIDKLVSENVLIFLAGDFNIDILRYDRESAAFLSLLGSFNLFPSIREYTRISGNSNTCIDNIFTNSSSYLSRVLNTHISDHTCQLISFELSASMGPDILKRRVFNRQGKKLFKYLLSEQDWQFVFEVDVMNVNAQWNAFMQIISPLFNCCFPVRSIRVPKKNKMVYYNSPRVIELKNQLDLLLVLSRADNGYKEAYRVIKHKYNTALKASRKEYYSRKIDNSDNKSKCSWQVVRDITGKSNKENNVGISGTPHQICNNLNDYMVNAAPQLMNNLPKRSFVTKILYHDKCMFLYPVTEVEIFNMINELKNTSSGMDEITAKIVKECRDELITPLCYIINNSFSAGIFPDGLKSALVHPLFKKGDPSLYENYRPISLLTTFSKIFEKTMYFRLMNFFKNYDLISASQHGFLVGRSINSAVFDFVGEVVSGFERSELALGSFLDLSKAFDSLDHSILLLKLEHYGVRGPPLEWIRSYLHNRMQKVVIQKDGCKYFSEDRMLTMGVPQGSVLGPLLFVCYINDLSSCIANRRSMLVNYADDTNLLAVATTVNDVLELGRQSLGLAVKWFQENNLILNEEKSSFVMFRTERSSAQCPEHADLLPGEVSFTGEAKFLGIYVDSHLNWKKEVEYVIGKLNRCCYLLRVLRNYLDHKTLFMVYHANFESILRFGVIFWGNAVGVQSVFLVQKRAVRLILGMKWRESCRGVFRRHGLLTLPGLHVFECVMFLQRNRTKFIKNVPNHSHNTRTLDFSLPTHRLLRTERSPTYSCLKYFNKLPNNIKQISNLTCFRGALLSYMIDLEPYTVAEFLSSRG